MPDALPVLPLRETVVFPLTIAPVSVDKERSRALLEDASRGNRLVALVAIREGEARPPRPEDLYAFGTAALVHDALRGPDDALRLAVQGLERVRIVGWARTEPYLVAKVHWMPDTVERGRELDELVLSARQLFLRFVSLVTELSSELAHTVDRVTDPCQLAYLLASTTPMTTEARQQILEQPSVLSKLRRMVEHLEHDIAVRELMRRIATETTSDGQKRERQVGLRRQLESIQRELGEDGSRPPASRDASQSPGDGEPAEARALRAIRAQIAELPLPEQSRKEVDREIERLERTPAASPEHGMIRTYLDWIVKLPWGRTTGARIDVPQARGVLDADHHDLTRVKDRIVEYLAVRRLRAERGIEGDGKSQASSEDTREPILCLVGPPGVGKTSLGLSIARALGRRFARIALGGIHDEAEIRGHRRTYIGAMPGRVLQAVARAEAIDPVFMLDEVDKLGVGFHGDPSAALLEVLDPAQNHGFTDSYLGMPFDLSRVLFVCTANGVDGIPAPLLDRMEVIYVAGYTDTEKLFIARRHLLPKAIAVHGLRPDEVSFDDEAIRRMVRGYTREAGVRGLGREIGNVLRKVACAVSEREGAGVVRVTEDGLPGFLGSPRFQEEVAERIERPGVATGLAWMPSGGEVLFVEASIVPGDDDRLVLTGMLGNVMRESAQAALSFLRANAERLGLDALGLRGTVHVHVPAGAVPKDGPSAGVTMLAAIASQASGRVVPGHIGMTGEVTLRGRILAVGGIKEKALAAHRAGLRCFVLPRRCEPQLEEVPDEVKAQMDFVFVDSAEQVLAATIDLGPLRALEPPTQPMIEVAPASVH
jgi:ATP-dependent Lon protease